VAGSSSGRFRIRDAAANTAARAQAAAQGVSDAAKQGRVAAREAVVKGMTMLRSVPLPIISRSGDEEERAFSSGSDSDSDEPNTMTYDLTVQEERLVQVGQGVGVMGMVWCVYVCGGGGGQQQGHTHRAYAMHDVAPTPLTAS
jgi:hypothetical protein